MMEWRMSSHKLNSSYGFSGVNGVVINWQGFSKHTLPLTVASFNRYTNCS
jgi:hypothetical protein